MRTNDHGFGGPRDPLEGVKKGSKRGPKCGQMIMDLGSKRGQKGVKKGVKKGSFLGHFWDPNRQKGSKIDLISWLWLGPGVWQLFWK